jgi:hypothetical protein
MSENKIMDRYPLLSLLVLLIIEFAFAIGVLRLIMWMWQIK